MVGLIGGVVLTGAVLVALFYGALLVMILRGNADKNDSLSDCGIKILVSLAVGAASIILTGGTALVGLFFIALYFGCAALFGKRRR
jgi:hypothetical protein